MGEKDTDIPGSPEFPSTVWSRLVHGVDPQAAAEHLASRYWKPVYFYVRRRWGRSNEDAKDLTQSFFADLLERGFISKAEPARGSFRHFLRASLENHLRNASRDAKALKRGGGVHLVPLQLLDEADVPEARGEDPSVLFDREWLQAILDRCLPLLEEQYAAEGRPLYYEIFRRIDLAGDPRSRPTYEELARDLKVPVTDVRNWLAHARSRCQKLARAELRETTSSPDDLEAEVKDLFGK